LLPVNIDLSYVVPFSIAFGKTLDIQTGYGALNFLLKSFQLAIQDPNQLARNQPRVRESRYRFSIPISNTLIDVLDILKNELRMLY